MEPAYLMSDAESGRMLQGVPGAAPLRGAAWRRRAAALAGALAVAACVSVGASSLAPQSKSALARSAVRGMTELDEHSNSSSPPASQSVVKKKGWPCEENEKIFFGDCMVDCDHATNGDYPYRHEACTCCKDKNATVGRCMDDCAKFNVGAEGKLVHKPLLGGCPYEHEEMYGGLCYMKCALLTEGIYPIRTGMNTCSNGEYGGNWTMGFGPCSGFGIGAQKCLPHIPVAAGMGFETPGNGEAPVGWTIDEPPMPNSVRDEVAELPAKLSKLSESSTDLVAMGTAITATASSK